MAFNRNHPLYVDDINYILSIEGLSRLRDKRILITGASGLIGVCLIDALMYFNKKQNAGVEIYAVGRSKEKAENRLGIYYNNPLFHFVEQDVIQPLPNELIVDYIIPGASNTHPLAYSQYPIETIQINVRGAENALIKAAQCGATVLYMSSVEIYGNAYKDDIFTEDYTGKLNLSNSRSCYTESKRVSESMCLSYATERNVGVKIVRLSRVFGPTMLPTDTKASSQFILKALEGEDIVLKSTGEQFFSYTYVADAVAAMLTVLLNGELGVAYNISNERCNVHLKDFAAICAKTIGKKVVFDLPTAIEQKGFSIASQAVLDNSRLKSLGFFPHYDIEDAINRTISIMK